MTKDLWATPRLSPIGLSAADAENNGTFKSDGKQTTSTKKS